MSVVSFAKDLESYICALWPQVSSNPIFSFAPPKLRHKPDDSLCSDPDSRHILRHPPPIHQFTPSPLPPPKKYNLPPSTEPPTPITMPPRIPMGLRSSMTTSPLRTTLRQPLLRRRVQTDAASPAQEQSAIMKWMTGPIGPKTVHFWAPVMKWALVLAGVADFARPAENLSLTQNAALMATGAIWTRWCLIIRPKNYFLAAVNAFLFLVGTTQVTRILIYEQSQKKKTGMEKVEDAVKEEAVAIKEGVSSSK
ncbi:UPF0041-domain-containing protein [Eremomyces bilateralis CBS 781.70]|uniref:Mitochondrial pyruvate carrier n=1 Tax=Eremomyces bilateralis CBS 781.70 TaxID=1392243 RepID=A0A6G1FSE2_9PEZI|nr:UPF0041-domain-containing protein [Eremomyces bilateralis CBS 781.70]KAF1808592.1 UPF0041-domain-containing protein [Eremomyces bilateralis CBS 781.70]